MIKKMNVSGPTVIEPENKNESNSKKPKDTVMIVKVLDAIILICLGMIMVLAPLFFTGLVAQGASFEKMMIFYFLVLIGSGFWVIKGVVQGELEIKRTPLDFPLLILAIILVLSTIFSVSPKDSLIGFYGNLNKSLAAFFAYVLFYLLLVNNINFKRAKIFFWALAGAAALVVFYSLFQIHGLYILPFDFTQNNYFNPIGSLTSLKMFIVLAIPLFLVGASQVKAIHPQISNGAGMVLKIFSIISAIVSFYILLVTNSSDFWATLMVSVVIILMFALTKIIPLKGGNMAIPVGAFLLTVAFLVLNNFNFSQLNLPSEVILTKKIFWDISKQSLKNDPLLGSGPSTFDYSFSRYKSEDINLSPLWNVRFDISNGFIFEILSTIGVLGTLLIIVVALTALSLGFISLSKSKDEEVSPVLLAFFASFISILVFAFKESMDNVLLLQSIIFSTLAAALAVMLYPEKFQVVKLSFRSSPKYALATAAVFLSASAGLVVILMFGVKMYLADVYARKSLVASDAGTKIVMLDKAINLFPYQDYYYLGQANNYMALVNDTINQGKQDGVEDNLAQAIALGKKSVEIAPNRAASNESLASIYENASFFAKGSLEWAENYYNKLTEIEPNNPVPYLRTALIYMAKANTAQDDTEKKDLIGKAIKKYDEAIKLKSDLHSAYYGKAVAQEQLDQTDQAIESLTSAINYAASAQVNNIDYSFELGRLYYNRGIAQAAPEGTVAMNDDLQRAKEIFMKILEVTPNHANSMYSLALLYQKTGDVENTKKYVGDLLSTVTDDATKEAIKQQFPGLY